MTDKVTKEEIVYKIDELSWENPITRRRVLNENTKLALIPINETADAILALIEEKKEEEVEWKRTLLDNPTLNSHTKDLLIEFFTKTLKAYDEACNGKFNEWQEYPAGSGYCFIEYLQARRKFGIK